MFVLTPLFVTAGIAVNSSDMLVNESINQTVQETVREGFASSFSSSFSSSLGEGFAQVAAVIAIAVVLTAISISLSGILLFLIGLRKLPWATLGTVAGALLGLGVARLIQFPWSPLITAALGAFLLHYYIAHHHMPIVGGVFYKIILRIGGTVGIGYAVLVGIKLLSYGSAGIPLLIICAVPGVFGLIAWMIE